MLPTVLLILAGLVLIVKGGDWFVDSSAWIAEVSGIPKLIVGATIVSFATTLPELLVSSFAAAEGNVSISVGNAVGSVTANLGLIMAIG
ncbi:MAG: sodium:calcium antiporter, partial [Clostridia bacterium]|nr:sodium:calcium antiporter [Clostridia bacterium]